MPAAVGFGGYAGDLRAARDAANGHFGSPGEPESGIIIFFLFLHNASLDFNRQSYRL